MDNQIKSNKDEKPEQEAALQALWKEIITAMEFVVPQLVQIEEEWSRLQKRIASHRLTTPAWQDEGAAEASNVARFWASRLSDRQYEMRNGVLNVLYRGKTMPEGELPMNRKFIHRQLTALNNELSAQKNILEKRQAEIDTLVGQRHQSYPISLEAKLTN